MLRSLGVGEPFIGLSLPTYPSAVRLVLQSGRVLQKNPFSFTPIQPEGQTTSRIQVIRHFKSYKGTYFLRKVWLLREQGAPPRDGRRYFQKYVNEAAKKEVEDIFRAAASKPPHAS